MKLASLVSYSVCTCIRIAMKIYIYIYIVTAYNLGKCPAKGIVTVVDVLLYIV